MRLRGRPSVGRPTDGRNLRRPAKSDALRWKQARFLNQQAFHALWQKLRRAPSEIGTDIARYRASACVDRGEVGWLVKGKRAVPPARRASRALLSGRGKPIPTSRTTGRLKAVSNVANLLSRLVMLFNLVRSLSATPPRRRGEHMLRHPRLLAGARHMQGTVADRRHRRRSGPLGTTS
jgi:hypothetical protein